MKVHETCFYRVSPFFIHRDKPRYFCCSLFTETTLVVVQTLAVPHWLSFKRQQEKQQLSVTKNEVKLCGVCIQFAGQFINELLNIILSACSL